MKRAFWNQIRSLVYVRTLESEDTMHERSDLKIRRIFSEILRQFPILMFFSSLNISVSNIFDSTVRELLFLESLRLCKFIMFSCQLN